MEAQANQSAASLIAAQVLLNGLRMDTPSISSRETKARQTYIRFLRVVRFLAQLYRDPPQFAPSLSLAHIWVSLARMTLPLLNCGWQPPTARTPIPFLHSIQKRPVLGN